MITELNIQNFKSIVNEKIDLGIVNVFIGENGCGKSNLLEALAFASAAVDNKFDTEALYNKGVRVAKPTLFFSSFFEKQQQQKISINLKFENASLDYEIKPEDKNDVFSKWENTTADSKFVTIINNRNKNEFIESMLLRLRNTFEDRRNSSLDYLTDDFYEFFKDTLSKQYEEAELLQPLVQTLKDYLIYCINTNTLRGLPSFQDSRKEPLGINGENLDVLIANLDDNELGELKKFSYLVSWLEDFSVDLEDDLKTKGFKLNRSQSTLYFVDKYMMKKNNIFSSENTNEGILHILFYLTLIISKKTPKLFAIDNIESCLNPHLCRELIKQMITLAKVKEKQILITTHNPAILDGLNLNDDSIRLFEVFRNNNGHTKTRRINFKNNEKPESLKLSELWMKGSLGAISKKF